MATLSPSPGYPGSLRSARRTNGPGTAPSSATPQHLAIFLVEATGSLSDPAMDLVKFIVKDSPSRAILNTFCSQIGGSIARYNAMAASELLPLLTHLGGSGCGLVLLHACSYVYNT